MSFKIQIETMLYIDMYDFQIFIISNIPIKPI